MRTYLVVILLLVISVSCKKDSDKNKLPTFDETFQVHFTLDNVDYNITLPEDVWNAGSGFTASANANNTMHYFGIGARFDLSNATYFDVQFGTGYGDLVNGRAEAFQSSLALTKPGSKIYDCLGSCSQNQADRVMVTYVDKDGVVWSNVGTTGGNDQSGSNFVVTERKEVSTYYLDDPDRRNNAVILKATFNCILYEKDGPRKKTLNKGSITALIGGY
jgi:hypothetical protein